MSFETLATWFAGVFAFILLDLIVVMLVRGAREAKRLQRRLAELADGPPGIDPARVAASLEKLQGAVDHIAPLIARSKVALVTIQRDIVWLRRISR